jgi:hypothetical protein
VNPKYTGLSGSSKKIGGQASRTMTTAALQMIELIKPLVRLPLTFF